MGFPVRKLIVRSTLIGVMLAGGLLSAGISQAQEVGVQTERAAELAAASGGPASSQHLIPFAADRAAVEAREAEVVGSPPESAPTVEATRLATASPAAAKLAVETAPVR